MTSSVDWIGEKCRTCGNSNPPGKQRCCMCFQISPTVYEEIQICEHICYWELVFTLNGVNQDFQFHPNQIFTPTQHVAICEPCRKSKWEAELNHVTNLNGRVKTFAKDAASFDTLAEETKLMIMKLVMARDSPIRVVDHGFNLDPTHSTSIYHPAWVNRDMYRLGLEAFFTENTFTMNITSLFERVPNLQTIGRSQGYQQVRRLILTSPKNERFQVAPLILREMYRLERLCIDLRWDARAHINPDEKSCRVIVAPKILIKVLVLNGIQIKLTQNEREAARVGNGYSSPEQAIELIHRFKKICFFFSCGQTLETCEKRIEDITTEIWFGCLWSRHIDPFLYQKRRKQILKWKGTLPHLNYAPKRKDCAKPPAGYYHREHYPLLHDEWERDPVDDLWKPFYGDLWRRPER